LTGIDEANPDPFIGSHGKIKGKPAIGCQNRRGIRGISPRRDGGAVGAKPPILDQDHFVAIDLDRLDFRDHQRPGP